MTLKEEVLKYKYIFSLMYSPTRVNFHSLEEQIIKIETSELQWSEDEEKFIYIWGWPGPDYNIYSRDTYGKGWAYTKKEIIKEWSK